VAERGGGGRADRRGLVAQERGGRLRALFGVAMRASAERRARGQAEAERARRLAGRRGEVLRGHAVAGEGEPTIGARVSFEDGVNVAVGDEALDRQHGGAIFVEAEGRRGRRWLGLVGAGPYHLEEQRRRLGGIVLLEGALGDHGAFPRARELAIELIGVERLLATREPEHIEGVTPLQHGHVRAGVGRLLEAPRFAVDDHANARGHDRPRGGAGLRCLHADEEQRERLGHVLGRGGRSIVRERVRGRTRHVESSAALERTRVRLHHLEGGHALVRRDLRHRDAAHRDNGVAHDEERSEVEVPHHACVGGRAEQSSPKSRGDGKPQSHEA
jgi:hypothetical protein